MNSVFFKLVGAITISVLLIFGCKPDEEPKCKRSNVYLNFKYKFGDSDFALETPYTNSQGESIMFTRSDVYFSNFKAQDKNGGGIETAKIYHLMLPGQTRYSMGAIATNYVDHCMFGIGIDSVTNKTVDPNTYPLDHPLGNKSPNMYWGWNQGYIFAALDGYIDTAGNGNHDFKFTYHIGLNELYRLSKSFKVAKIADASSNIDINITLDYAKIVDGVHMQTEPSTHSFSDFELAKKLADNLSGAFTVE